MIMKKAPTLNDDEPVRTSSGCRKWVGRVGNHPPRFWQTKIIDEFIAVFLGFSIYWLLTQIFNASYGPELEGSVPQIKLEEAASIALKNTH